MLYLIATPIGNLKDITLRAIETLKECDLILCEDTRHSSHLLEHLEIKKPLISFHQFNEAKREEEVLSLLRQGKKIALISDAGTPAISDPGEALVKRLRLEGVPVSPIPGPSSVITALAASGLGTIPFQFLGFFPRTQLETRKTLAAIALFEGTSLFFESPERLLQTLEILSHVGSDWEIVIARELTKTFEEFVRGTPSEVLEKFKGRKILGEIVVLARPAQTLLQKELETMDAKALAEQLQELFDLPLKDAIKIAASWKGISKQNVYREFT
ncbi:16S rRNA (cytidine(1402)-2'-O)-methyltransferase [Estrella lausannensis]|uniref:Ribosomal RNA small subunit methyltransferase I n=1 Tax=Estrella lausannensis TaxID=483423 RepID=A0A0H5DS13_9BACT|nr:16S rRNA (cytidine(1402)-2'-O)-methyltransferase [Estrella lausannensis]CRX38514.1 Ribosomal RNA small subunit methyltransferase I [Estrella lausannensis]